MAILCDFPGVLPWQYGSNKAFLFIDLAKFVPVRVSYLSVPCRRVPIRFFFFFFFFIHRRSSDRPDSVDLSSCGLQNYRQYRTFSLLFLHVPDEILLVL